MERMENGRKMRSSELPAHVERRGWTLVSEKLFQIDTNLTRKGLSDVDIVNYGVRETRN